MTFDEYLATGGDRFEKLVVIYKTKPEALTKGTRALLTALEEGASFEQFDELQFAHSKWEDGTIQKDLSKQDADFV